MDRMIIHIRDRQAAELMTPIPVCVDLGSSVREAMQLLSHTGLRHLPVTERGKLVGIISDRDLRTVAGDYLNVESDTTARPYPIVADFCERNVITVAPDDDVTKVIDLMLSHNIGALPVVKGPLAEVVGIVSYVDVLRAIRDAL